MMTKFRKQRGRPREFDMEQALDAAILLFRERGYHDTSLTDLGSAMGLAPGRIYKAFKDKQEIFAAVFDRYVHQRHLALEAALAVNETGRAKLRATLLFLAESAHGNEGKIGCLVVGSTTDLTTLAPDIASKVVLAGRRMEQRFRDLVVLGQTDGSINKTIDPAVMSNTLLCLTQGFRVAGKIGRSRAAMTATVEQIITFL